MSERPRMATEPSRPGPGIGSGRLIERVTDLGWAAGWAVVGRLPERLVRSATTAIADLVWRGSGKQVRRLESNLARVRPEASPGEIRELSRQGMRSYARYWGEAFRLHRLSRQDVLERVVTHHEERLHDALATGKGVVAALPHQANWDLAGAWVRARDLTLTTVAERLKPEKLFDRFVAYRRALGMEILPLTGGEDPFPLLADRLRAGGLVCLVSDRDLSERGVEVDFFGAVARMPAGPVVLGARTGAAVLPVTMWYEGDRMHVWFHPPVGDKGSSRSIRERTQQLADAFAEGIAAHPEDWHMLQRLWIADLERPAA